MRDALRVSNPYRMCDWQVSCPIKHLDQHLTHHTTLPEPLMLYLPVLLR
jgi:hypothetical protein